MSKKEESNKTLEVLHTMHGDYCTTLTSKYKNRTPWQPQDPKKVISFIPGTITSIEVCPGQEIKTGDTLLTFKAMKMLNTYKSPVDGTVAKVWVSPGDVVPKGMLLIEFR